MRKLILTFLVCTSLSAFAQKTNFSGTWQLDTLKTAFGEAPRSIIPKIIKIDQQAAQLVLTRISLNDQMQEQPAMMETLALDGTPFQKTPAATPVTTTLHWLDDSTLMLTRNGTLNATETWTLEDGGKTLFIDRSVEQKSNGYKYTIKCYYTRQM